MAFRSPIFGVRVVSGSAAPVEGLVILPRANQPSISWRSYVCPSAQMTGSVITSLVIGQKNEGNGSVDDMLPT
jgi:hypothetical protein